MRHRGPTPTRACRRREQRPPPPPHRIESVPPPPPVPRTPAPWRLMAVHAHPDDESSKGAATMRPVRSRGASRCWSSPVPGASGQHPQPRDGPPLACSRHARDPPRRDGPRREILGVQHAWLGFVDSGLPRATRCRRCRRAASRSVDLERHAEPLVPAGPQFRPHVWSPTTRTAATRTPTTSAATRSRWPLSTRRATDRFPGRGRAVAAVKLYYNPGSPGPGSWPSTRRAGARTRVAVRRVAGELAADARTPGARSPPGCRAATSSPSATRRCRRTRPRSTRTALVRGAARHAGACGPPRTTSSSARGRRPLPEDDLFAGIEGRRRGPAGGLRPRRFTGSRRGGDVRNVVGSGGSRCAAGGRHRGPDGARAEPGSHRPAAAREFGKSSPIALVVILLLGLATVLLIRSMTKRIQAACPRVSRAHGRQPRGARCRRPGGTGDAGGTRSLVL